MYLKGLEVVDNNLQKQLPHCLLIVFIAIKHKDAQATDIVDGRHTFALKNGQNQRTNVV